MAKRRVTFTFPEELVSKPIIYNIGQQFNLTTNICQAHVTEDQGWFTLELEGRDEDIEAGISWVTSKGVRVDSISDLLPDTPAQNR